MKHSITIIIALLVYTTTAQARLSASRQSAAPGAFVFVENKGQIVDQHHAARTDIDAKLQVNGLGIFVGDGAIHYQWLKGTNTTSTIAVHQSASAIETYRLDVELVGANRNATLIKENAQQYFETYYLPQCKEGMTAHSYQKLVYKNIYSNIDWVLYVQQGKLKYDFVVRPGGRVSDIQLRYSGATSLAMQNGSIVASTPMGSITEQKPYSYNAQTKREVASGYVLNGNTMSFTAAPTDGTLVIDPTLEWGTYFGTLMNDYIYGLAADEQGFAYAAGVTPGLNIATIGAHQVVATGGNDGFLVRFNPLGQLVWSTYYGGELHDACADVAVDEEGMVYITGSTSSKTSIATPGAHQEQHVAMGDAFLVKFNTSGQRIWGTYFGSTGNDIPVRMAIDPGSHIYLVGRTTSMTDIATTNAHQVNLDGDEDAFLVKFDKNGKLDWATYYGGEKSDEGMAVSCDGLGNVYIAGGTESTKIVTLPGAHDNTANGQMDAFLAKFNSTGKLLWNTYYGGIATEAPFGLACDASNNVIMSGHTLSETGIASPGSQQPTKTGITDCFVVKFNSAGVRQWGTYAGGNTEEWGGMVAADAERNIYFLGSTQSTSGIAFPNSHQPTHGGGVYDLFMTKYDESGSILSATYFGGSDVDVHLALGISRLGDIYFGGYTRSTNAIATPGAHQPVHAGANDAFIAKFYDTVAFIRQPYMDTAWCLPRSISVPYVAHLGFDASNVFSIELSDAGGSFVSPTVIGSVASNTSGTIPVNLPANLPAGTGYRIRLRASSPAYISKDNGINIAIAPAITISAADVSAVCTDATIKFTLNNPQPGLSYLWTGPNSFTSTLAEPAITNAQQVATGDYIITATANGCRASDTVTVVVNPKPSIAKMAHPEPVCAGGVIRFWAVSAMAGSSYQWYGPAGFMSNLERPEIHGATGANSGRYVVLLKSPDGCISDSNFVNAEVIELKASIKPLRRFEAGDTLALFGSANADSVTYSWEGPGGFYSELQNPVIIDVTPPYRGDYFLTVTSKYGCKATASVHAIVSDLITFNLFPNPNNGRFTIKGNTKDDQVVHMEVVDATGRSIYRDEVKTFRRHFTKEVDTEGRLANGSYILRLDVEGKTQDVRFAVGR